MIQNNRPLENAEHRSYTYRENFTLGGQLLTIAVFVSLFAVVAAPQFMLGAAVGAVGIKLAASVSEPEGNLVERSVQRETYF